MKSFDALIFYGPDLFCWNKSDSGDLTFSFVFFMSLIAEYKVQQ